MCVRVLASGGSSIELEALASVVKMDCILVKAGDEGEGSKDNATVDVKADIGMRT